MVRKALYAVSLALFLSGMLFIIGSAGASDCETISVTKFMINSLTGLILVVLGYIGLCKGGFLNENN